MKNKKQWEIPVENVFVDANAQSNNIQSLFEFFKMLMPIKMVKRLFLFQIGKKTAHFRVRP